MARGEQKSHKETRKPKKDKKAPAAAPVLGQASAAAAKPKGK